MPSQLWPYITPGIPDELFERLPGIPLSKREIRLLLIAQLQLKPDSVLLDIGADTGTIPVEVGLLCPQERIIPVESDEEVTNLIRKNCDCFGIENVQVVKDISPDCLSELKQIYDHICIEGGQPIQKILQAVWDYLPESGRIVATAFNLEMLYSISQSFSQLQARNVEVVQSAINRLENRGFSQTLTAVDPMFILSGEKLD